jgi:hypothetical protein
VCVVCVVSCVDQTTQMMYRHSQREKSVTDRLMLATGSADNHAYLFDLGLHNEVGSTPRHATPLRSLDSALDLDPRRARVCGCVRVRLCAVVAGDGGAGAEAGGTHRARVRRQLPPVGAPARFGLCRPQHQSTPHPLARPPSEQN